MKESYCTTYVNTLFTVFHSLTRFFFTLLISVHFTFCTRHLKISAVAFCLSPLLYIQYCTKHWKLAPSQMREMQKSKDFCSNILLIDSYCTVHSAQSTGSFLLPKWLNVGPPILPQAQIPMW